MTAVENAIHMIRNILGAYIWHGTNESDVHRQMIDVFASNRDHSVLFVVVAQHEVRIGAGRLDFLVTVTGTISGVLTRVAIEVKVKGSATEIERQAQRYALSGDVDAVVVVTTSRKLALQLNASELGGKPFAAIALRGAF